MFSSKHAYLSPLEKNDFKNRRELFFRKIYTPWCTNWKELKIKKKIIFLWISCKIQRLKNIERWTRRTNIAFISSEAELKEFEPRLKFETGLKYGWFHFKLYSMFKIWAGVQLKPVFGGFETQLKFVKFGQN